MSTLDCRHARSLLLPALDSELEVSLLVTLQQHLAACEACRRRFAAEEAVERALLAALDRDGEPMPAPVWERLAARLAAEAATGAGAPASSAPPRRAAVAAAGALRRGRRPLRAAAALAAALLLVIAWWVARGGPGTSPVAPLLLDDLLAAHERAAASLGGGPWPELGDAHAADAAGQLLAARGLPALALPREGRAGRHPVRLLVAREEQVGPLTAVHVLYDCCGRLTSVLLLPEAEVGEVAPAGQPHGDLKVATLHRPGLYVGVVSRHSTVLSELL